MEDKSRLAQIFESIGDWLGEQEWFQELKAKWEELDPKSRMNLQIAGIGGSVLLVVALLFTFYMSVYDLRKEVNDKSDLLTMLTSASDELRSLQTTNATVTGGLQSGGEPWPTYFETQAGSAGIAKPNLTISDSKKGGTTEVANETLYDVSMKKVSIRQAIRYAVTLESGARPVKLRNLTIDTQPDGSGYLDATLSVSAFAALPKQ